MRSEFECDSKSQLAQNLVSRWDPLEATFTKQSAVSTNHVFTHKVDEVKPVTNQKSTGRCWLFACVNAMRVAFVKDKQVDDFEFSQNYLFFWDKIERCNYFLDLMIDLALNRKEEKPDGRLMSFLLHNPTCDGGQWDMVVNLIRKHGVVPKKCFPEAYSAENSRRMNDLLKTKLREFAFELRSMAENEAKGEEELREKVRLQMKVVYRIVSICLGTPPDQFVWEYYDKSKKYHKLGPISPLEFYEAHVKPVFNMEDKVCLVCDPRPQNPHGRAYTVDCLGNVVGGKKTVYNNQPIEKLIALAAQSIKKGQAVWFGCDVSKHMASKQGLLDTKAHNHDLVFGTKIHRVLSKADRLVYGDSQMNHAMVLTGVHMPDGDDQGEPLKWRVENSWGEDRHEKGYLVMTNEWFKEFVFEVVVDKDMCPKEVLDVFEAGDPVVLPAWDPMGALA